MTRLLLAGAMTMMPTLMTAESAPYSGVTGNANLFIGQKSLEKDGWELEDKQTEVGVMFDMGGTNWPVNIALDLLVSSDEETVSDVDLEMNTAELDIGLRRSFLKGNLHPYVGGGLALIQAEVEAKKVGKSKSDDDTGVGFWVSGGFYYSIIGHINVGVDLRYSKAKATLFDSKGEVGGAHYGLFAGYHW